MVILCELNERKPKKEPKYFRRFCRRCGLLFEPTSRQQKICFKCWKPTKPKKDENNKNTKNNKKL